MDRDEGLQPHIIGFMRRKREKERLENEKQVKAPPFGGDSARAADS